MKKWKLPADDFRDFLELFGRTSQRTTSRYDVVEKIFHLKNIIFSLLHQIDTSEFAYNKYSQKAEQMNYL